jgi:phosphate transport system substrate-binding protein
VYLLAAASRSRTPKDMLRKFLILVPLVWTAVTASASPGDIVGAGSSAAKPLYMRWAQAFSQQTGISLNYQPVGSSAGIKQIEARAVDFGASDVAIGRDEAAKEHLICFPSAISGVVPVVNLPRVKAGELQLTGELLAAIFSRRIKTWNDPAIAEENPSLVLPKLPITIVVRQDGSGTTYNFTDYLSKISPAWKQSIGTNFTVEWPADAQRAKGSAGVVEAVKASAGAIGYVDYNYVVQDKLNYARMKNRDGRTVSPSPRAFSAALSNSAWKTAGRFEEMLTDKSGSDSWPITMGTFVIVPQQTAKVEATAATLQFFTWAFMKGDQIADGLDFVRLPDAVQGRIFKELTRITDREGRPLQWKML